MLNQPVLHSSHPQSHSVKPQAISKSWSIQHVLDVTRHRRRGEHDWT